MKELEVLAMGIDGEVAVVTGGARGIGKAIAQALTSEGASVALADVLADDLRQTAQELASQGATVLPIVADVTQAEQVDAMVEQAEAELGPIAALVNNAGTFSTIGPVWEADPDRWFRDVRVNLFGSFLCCRAVARRMVERGRGTIVNIASSGGVSDAHPYCTSYACSKTALVRLTEGLARELQPHGVCVFAVGPPAVRTAMTEFILTDPGGRRWRPGFERIFAEGRDHPPELVADLVLGLLSGSADALTGRFLPATRPLADILRDADEILARGLLTLRLRS